MTAKIIPRFEPEVIDAAAQKHYWGDAEKVATTSIRTLVVFGVDIVSRYNKAEEYELMQAMICALSPMLRNQIKSVFCDSKATNNFSVVLRTWHTDLARVIGLELEAVAIEQRGGHNGIFVTSEGERNSVEIDADWRDIGP